MVDEDARMEELLRRYRPAGPADCLRERVLSARPPRRSWWVVVGWSAAAAAIVISIGLNLAATRIDRDVASTLNWTTIRWTPQAEEMAQMLDGDGAGRRYLELCLAAGTRQPEPFSLGSFSRMGDIQ